MSPVRAVLLACLVGMAITGGALANHQDPQKRVTPADQARAKAMLLRKADFPATFRALPPSPDTHVTCKALDESDLTLSGDATSGFAGGTVLFLSTAQVYATQTDSRMSWRRFTSAPGVRCLRETFRREAARSGVVLRSFRRTSFPRLAEQSDAFRMVATRQGVRAVADIVILRQGRGQAAVLITSVRQPLPKAEEVRLARVVAGRMARAMRGG
jgi:hypothetical protein